MEMQYIEKNRKTENKKPVVSENLHSQLDEWIMLSVIEITETSEVHQMKKPLENKIVGEVLAFSALGSPRDQPGSPAPSVQLLCR